MMMPGRHGESTSSDYRYGYNGQERDDEVKGVGNSYDFGARIQDPRLGRFLSLDPLTSVYTSISPYCYAANTPIMAIDAEGKGPVIIVQSKTASESIKTSLRKYQAGEITFKELNEQLKYYMSVPFKDRESISWAEMKYEQSGLGPMRYSGKYITKPTNIASPDVAYEEQNIDDGVLYLTLVEEDENGNWSYVNYEVVDPERKAWYENKITEQVGSLFEEILTLTAELKDTEGQLYRTTMISEHYGSPGGAGPLTLTKHGKIDKSDAYAEIGEAITREAARSKISGLEAEVKGLQNKLQKKYDLLEDRLQKLENSQGKSEGVSKSTDTNSN